MRVMGVLHCTLENTPTASYISKEIRPLPSGTADIFGEFSQALNLLGGGSLHSQ